jgi:hypothetical protein
VCVCAVIPAKLESLKAKFDLIMDQDNVFEKCFIDLLVYI